MRALIFGLCLVVLSAGAATASPSALTSAAPLTLRGRVVDAKGAPVPEASVTLARAAADSEEAVIASTDADGSARFLIAGVLPGKYVVVAREQQRGGEGRVAVTLRPGRNDDVVVRIATPQTQNVGLSAWTPVTVRYVTNRKRLRDGPTGARYANEAEAPNTPRARAMHYGTAVVTIPATHTRGELERWGLGDLFEFRFRADSAHHIIVDRVAESDRAHLFDGLRTEAGTATPKPIVVYVHGFKTSFDLAMRTAAQIKWDLLPVDVAMIAYTWPSRNSISVQSYFDDGEESRRAVASFVDFVTELSRRSGGAPVDVIAHSMGNRIVSAALLELGIRRSGKRIFDQVVMAAPDVPSLQLRRGSCTMAAAARGLTLYASQRDQALRVAALISQLDRAGFAEPLLIANGIQTVDATLASTDFLGHGYLATNIDMLNDIQDVLRDKPPPRSHLLGQQSKSKAWYWRLADRGDAASPSAQRGPACPEFGS